jgi:hypothetical protein
MKHLLIPSLVVLVCASSGLAQSGAKRPSATGMAPVTDIRHVDFLNFTYECTLCAQEYAKQGIRKTVRVREGEFKTKTAYLSVDQSRIVFADLTSDGAEDAIVPLDCGAMAANFSRSEIDVYTVKAGRAARLASITDKDLERDVRKAYPQTESYWGLGGSGVTAGNGNLRVEVLVDGPHAAPKDVVTLEYHWSGDHFGLSGPPERRAAPQ